MLKKIIYALLTSLVIIQFIRPDKNEAAPPFKNDIENIHPMNATVKTALQRACYDCHSNNTTYPWYAEIQPVRWWLQHHEDEGKEHLNFNEMAAYSPDKRDHKLEEILEAVDDGWMPLSSYTLVHKDAVLSAEEKTAISEWIMQIRKGNTSVSGENEHVHNHDESAH